MKYKYTNGSYPPSNGIVFCCEAPGQHELRAGLALVGPSGQIMRASCANVGISFDESYSTNYHKDAPPSDIKRLTPKQHEVARETLHEELEDIKDDIRVIVPMGNIALQAFTPYDDLITHRRGSIYWCEWIEKWIIPTVHPAFVLRTMRAQYGASKTQSYLPLFEADLLRIRDFDAENFQYPEREFLTGPRPISEIETFLHEMLQREDYVAYDIETWNPGPRINCIGVGAHDRAMCIPFELDTGESVYSVAEEARILHSLDAFFDQRTDLLSVQNLLFDDFILRHYGLHPQPSMDTMVAMHCAYSELPRALHVLSSLFDSISYYKEEGKNWNPRRDGGIVRFWEYNCSDVCTTAYIARGLEKELQDLGKLDYYRNFHHRFTRDYLLPTNMRGMRIDIEKMHQMREDYGRQLVSLETSIRTKGCNVENINSYDQLKKLVYEDMGIKPILDQKSKRPTLNRDAIETLSKKHNIPWAEDYLELSRIRKLVSTYLTNRIADEDGRSRTHFSLATETDRLSSKASAFGSGGNQQNLPKRHKDSRRIRSIYIADPGRVLLSMDLVQAEAHVVMFAAKDKNGMDIFNNGLDIHTMTASLMFNAAYDDIDKNGPLRRDAKACVHALNYDMRERKFAQVSGLPYQRCKVLRPLYFSIYQGIKSEYHPWIEACLRKDRTIVNPWGWSRTFYGAWGHELLKEGYAHYPQNIVGTLLDRIWMRAADGGLDLCMHIHDQIVAQVRPTEVEEACQLLWSCNEEVNVRGTNITIGMDFAQGDNLGELEDVTFAPRAA